MKTFRWSLVGTLLAAATAQADLRLHELPPDNGQEVATAVQTVLPSACQVRGIPCASRYLTSGQLLVEAPEDVQAELTGVLRAIEDRSPAPIRHVTLQYWILRARPGAADEESPDLRRLRRVLAALEDEHGELGFSLLDRRSLTSIPGETATLSGERNSNLRQSIRANGEVLTAELSLSYVIATDEPDSFGAMQQQGITGNVTLDPDAPVVLGESTAGDGTEKLVYIVEWDTGG